jgi:hypothetical protein
MDELLKYAWLTVWLTICAGVGAYFGSYLKKKGENLATHEDVDEVVKEVRAVTRTTEEIKADISGDLWDRQKKWELKRDALFEATKVTVSLQVTLAAMQGFYQTQKTFPDETPERLAKLNALCGDFNKAASSFDQATMLVGIACGAEVFQESLYLALLARNLADKLNSGQRDIFSNSLSEWADRVTSFRTAIRKELELPNFAQISTMKP